MKRRVLAILLTLALALSVVPSTAFADTTVSQSQIKTEIQYTAEYLTSIEPNVYSYWNVMYVATAGVQDQAFYNAYAQAVKEELDNNGGKLLSYGAESMSVYAATILTLSKIGEDPTAFEGYDLVSSMVAMGTDGIESQYYCTTLPVILWALNAYADEINGSTLEEAALAKMLTFFDGEGFSTSYEWEGVKYYDVDSTAMCIAALQMYYDTNADVKEKVDTSIEFIKARLADGSVSSVYTASKVLTAFSILGGDLVANAEIDGVNIVDYVLSYKSAETVGAYASWGVDDEMATYQALEALLSYDRMLSGTTHIYDLSYKSDNGSSSESEGVSSETSTVTTESSTSSQTAKSSSPATGDSSVTFASFGVLLVAAAIITAKKKINR